MKGAKRAIPLLAVCLILGLGWATQGYCQEKAGAEVINLKYAGGAEGDGTYRSALAIASLVNKYSKRIKIFVQISPGTTVTPKMIQKGLVDLCAGSQSGETQAIEGLADYKGDPVKNLRRLFVWGESSYVLFCPAEKDIHSIKDLVGKKVGIGAKTQPTGKTCETVLQTLGLADKCKYSFNTSAVELGERIKDGLYDVGFYGVSHPWAVLMDLATTRKMRIFGVGGEDLEKSVKVLTPRYGATTMPANIYPGQDKGFDTIGALQTTLVRADLAEDVAYEIIKIVDTHLDEFGLAYPPAKFYFPNMDSQKREIAPFHPATVRWLKEKGVKLN